MRGAAEMPSCVMAPSGQALTAGHAWFCGQKRSSTTIMRDSVGSAFGTTRSIPPWVSAGNVDRFVIKPAPLRSRGAQDVDGDSG
jgi:hypothetical protein